MILPALPLVARLRAIAVLLAFAGLSACGGSKHPAAPLTDADRHSLDDYERIRVALADDDVKAAKKAAAQMVTDLTPADPKVPASPLLEPVTGVADATALDTMRQHFEKLSNRVVPMVTGVEGYYVMRSDLPNTVPWVQQTSDVDNPFFGKAMHRIGERQK